MAKLTEFGKEVKKTLIDLEMEIPELAENIGISIPYLRDILKGARPGKKIIPVINSSTYIVNKN